MAAYYKVLQIEEGKNYYELTNGDASNDAHIVRFEPHVKQVVGDEIAVRVSSGLGFIAVRNHHVVPAVIIPNIKLDTKELLIAAPGTYVYALSWSPGGSSWETCEKLAKFIWTGTKWEQTSIVVFYYS